MCRINNSSSIVMCTENRVSKPCLKVVRSCFISFNINILGEGMNSYPSALSWPWCTNHDHWQRRECVSDDLSKTFSHNSPGSNNFVLGCFLYFFFFSLKSVVHKNIKTTLIVKRLSVVKFFLMFRGICIWVFYLYHQ